MLLSSVGMAIRLGSVLPCASILAACTPGAPAKPIAAQHLVERDASTLEASVGASPDAAEVDVDDGGAVVAKPNAFRAWLSVQRVAPPTETRPRWRVVVQATLIASPPLRARSIGFVASPPPSELMEYESRFGTTVDAAALGSYGDIASSVTFTMGLGGSIPVTGDLSFVLCHEDQCSNYKYPMSIVVELR